MEGDYFYVCEDGGAEDKKNCAQNMG